MADKAVSELIKATQVRSGDKFVLEQDGTAKQLEAQVLELWLLSMADGHGGIHAIEKVKSAGLLDTYRITLADTTTFDYIITNGKGIADIKYGFKDGLIDHYNVLFNDGTTFSYTVTNGAKGDQGDAIHVHIKYASQEPTDASHSMSDLPDEWMGIYTGLSEQAPTNWRQYRWYRIKGAKGDTGAPAVLLETVVEYQTSNTGAVPPSGVWVSNVPAVPQGKYLWTRTTKKFNSGEPVVSYSVGYVGMDGTVSFEELTEEQKEEVRGGYYEPSVAQQDGSTMRMSFTPSKTGMPAVDPVQIQLPAGPAGKDGGPGPVGPQGKDGPVGPAGPSLGEDYIVAQGTSGIWFWRKWNSGAAECWGTQEFTGEFTYYDEHGFADTESFPKTNYPFDFLFAPRELVTGYIKQEAESTYVVQSSCNTPEATAEYYFQSIVDYLTSEYTFGISYYVAGRWK